MFRRRADIPPDSQASSGERISSVLADGTSLRGKLTGTGGVRIEGAFEGEIDLDGLLVIGPSGRVTCEELKARSVIVAGAMRGNILAERVEIRSTGRVWGDVTTGAMSTQEGAFLRGQIQMEDNLSIKPDVKPPDLAEEKQPKKKGAKSVTAKAKGKVKTKK